MYVQTCGGYVGWGGGGIETTQVSQCLTNYVKTAFQFKSYFCIVITLCGLQEDVWKDFLSLTLTYNLSFPPVCRLHTS